MEEGLSQVEFADPMKTDDDTSSNKDDSSSVKKQRSGMRKCLLCGLGVFLALCLAATVTFCIIYFLGPNAGVVETEVGTIRGRVVQSAQGSDVEEYLGIPFAEKPLGTLRYADPVPLKQLPHDPYDATDFKYSCMQILDTSFGDFPGSAMWNAPNPLSEDCLYLNIWVPRNRDRTRKLAVMVWIYGGGFFSGSNALWVYDGKSLAAFGQVIVTSLNYRVGTFGYLSTGDGRIPGNFGMKDQALALKWIKTHIAAFGGDPDSITIFGESSGASSAGLHMMSDHSKDLFQRAIFESGSPDSHWSFMTRQQAKERSAIFFGKVGCQQTNTDDLLRCLRALPADEILNNEWVDPHFMVFPWAPTVDGDFLRDTPHNLVYQGRFANKDTLLGINKDEGTYWILSALPGLYRDQPSLQNYSMFRNGVDTIVWDLPERTREYVKTLYTPDDISDLEANRDNLDKVAGDRSFTCPTEELTRVFAANGLNTYLYYLTYRASNEVWHPWMGVIHGAEIQWVFGMPMNDSRGYTEDEVEFSKIIMSYWTNFAKTGDPNNGRLPEWPRYTHDEPKYLEFRGVPHEFHIGKEIREKYCNFWVDINNQTYSNPTASTT